MTARATLALNVSLTEADTSAPHSIPSGIRNMFATLPSQAVGSTSGILAVGWSCMNSLYIEHKHSPYRLTSIAPVF